MSEEINSLIFWIKICLVIASVGTTLVPFIYAFSPWYKTNLGRAFMTQALAFSLAVDMTTYFAFRPPEDIRVRLWANAAVFTIIAVSTIGLAILIWRLNYSERVKMNQTHPLLSNKAYDQLKFLVTIVLPAFGALYYGLSNLWDLPKALEVVGTVALVTTFFGAVLKLSSVTYNNSDEKYDGHIVVQEGEDGIPVASLHLKNYENPADVVQQEQVIFKVTQ